ncbi:glycoside hydrolase [Aureobasidium sp. EXF-8845]|nr:glycoside hydrolase [Aureobasidium sp. EXF-8845]KAI4849273.1 glycoside hydrolase [Aureobasidium sp. EXF-8846]
MMRTGVAALGALSLINLASAKPNGHHRRHQQLHEKRQDVVYETDYTYVTTQLPNVVVFVDENGTPYSTSTDGQAAATSAAAAVYTEAAAQPAYTEAASSSTEIYVAPTPSQTTLASVYNKAASSKDSTTVIPAYSSPAAYSSAATSASSSKAAASSPAASADGLPQGYGIVYSPYRDDGKCKEQDEVNNDFEKIMAYASSNGESYDFVRLYGADCNGPAMILNICEKYDLKIFAGIFNVLSDAEMTTEIKVLTDAVSASGKGWSRFNTISIGNEVVNNGKLAATDVAGKVTLARTLLSAAGYSGKMVAVDTAVAMIAHGTDLCGASDYVAVNAHPFFDGNVAAADSGEWLLHQMQELSTVCGKPVWITETGWPTQGNTNGKAVPSVQNQKAALSSMKSAVTSNVVWFTAFNDMWKTNSAATFNAEQYWGMCNN